MKSQIDGLADELIQRLESYERRFKAEFKTNLDIERFNDLLRSAQQQSVEYEKFLNLFSTEKEEQNEKRFKYGKLINKLQSEIKDVKAKLFSNLSFSFKPSQNNVQDFFGELIIEVS